MFSVMDLQYASNLFYNLPSKICVFVLFLRLVLLAIALQTHRFLHLSQYVHSNLQRIGRVTPLV